MLITTAIVGLTDDDHSPTQSNDMNQNDFLVSILNQYELSKNKPFFLYLHIL